MTSNISMLHCQSRPLALSHWLTVLFHHQPMVSQHIQCVCVRACGCVHVAMLHTNSGSSWATVLALRRNCGIVCNLNTFPSCGFVSLEIRIRATFVHGRPCTAFANFCFLLCVQPTASCDGKTSRLLHPARFVTR